MIMEIVSIIILIVGLCYFFRVLKKILDTHTIISCKSLGLKVYDQWRSNFKYNPVGGIEHFQPLIRWDPKSNQGLLAIGYKARIENKNGWEYQIVWEVIDIIHGRKIDQWFYGTALPNSVAGAGNMKKTKEEIEHDNSEKKRGEKILYPFEVFYWS